MTDALLKVGLALLIGLIVMVGCAIPIQPAGPQPAAALTHWQLQGRIAVADGNQGWQANVRWRQQDQRYAIELIGPFGQGRVALAGDPEGVVMQTAQGELSATDPETLLAQATGARVPISGLRYWVRGLSDPGQPSRPTWDGQGRIVRLKQNGWDIEYPNYDRVAGLMLPLRLHARRGGLEVKLIITEWLL